jgi:hypothetical protein
MRASEARPPQLRQVAPWVPLELQAICEKAMARDADARYRSAHELADALEGFQVHAAQGRTASWVTWTTRALVGVTLLCLLAGVAMSLLFSSSLLEQGAAAVGITLPLAFVGFLLVGIEYLTRGARRLLAVGLAVAAALICIGVANTAMGWGVLFTKLSEPSIVGNPQDYRALLAVGLRESTGNIPPSLMFAAVQVVLWALVHRRNAQHPRTR